MYIGPSALRVAAIREPSGESAVHQYASGSRSNRVSSAPRPFKGSRAEMISCLPSSVSSAIAHNSDGDLAHVIMLHGKGLGVNSIWVEPPIMRHLITGIYGLCRILASFRQQ